jgi:hypothetical protein
LLQEVLVPQVEDHWLEGTSKDIDMQVALEGTDSESSTSIQFYLKSSLRVTIH